MPGKDIESRSDLAVYQNNITSWYNQTISNIHLRLYDNVLLRSQSTYKKGKLDNSTSHSRK